MILNCISLQLDSILILHLLKILYVHLKTFQEAVYSTKLRTLITFLKKLRSVYYILERIYQFYLSTFKIKNKKYETLE